MNILKVTKKVKSNILNAWSNLGIKSTDIKFYFYYITDMIFFYTTFNKVIQLLLFFLRNNFKGSVMIFNI